LEQRVLKGKFDMRLSVLVRGVIVFVSTLLASSLSSAQVSDAVAAVGETVVTRLHAEGAQIYECKADAGGKLAWQFREPIATLLLDNKTVGRHYAGPTWELTDGSAIAGKIVGHAAGATPKDIPLLKLGVVSQRGAGQLSAVATIQRLNTKGGVAEGPCAPDGAFLSVPYSADYAFLKKSD
jgi:hypothetical protein